MEQEQQKKKQKTTYIYIISDDRSQLCWEPINE